VLVEEGGYIRGGYQQREGTSIRGGYRADIAKGTYLDIYTQ
jgi:hypothetical protein